ncbi:MAG: hypothetical protein LBU56_02485 [Rickettsiales bacterium]|jgi:hypothetical protein|nr:hypothetical protein [Rickettsiales bacterium]
MINLFKDNLFVESGINAFTNKDTKDIFKENPAFFPEIDSLIENKFIEVSQPDQYYDGDCFITYKGRLCVEQFERVEQRLAIDNEANVNAKASNTLLEIANNLAKDSLQESKKNNKNTLRLSIVSLAISDIALIVASLIALNK